MEELRLFLGIMKLLCHILVNARVKIIRTTREVAMEDKKFFYLLGVISYISWPLYFLMKLSEYPTSDIVEALTFITVVAIFYFIILYFYFD